VFSVWVLLDTELPLAGAGAAARRAEALGCDCIAVPDMAHDGLLLAAAAAQATTRVSIATSALVCFARSPMTVAVAAWDLQALSGGRFRLGLGPLVAPILTGKYGTPWHPPAPRMREYVGALRAIFACWQDDVPLDFKGQHYRFTRQSAFNKPPRSEHPRIPIHLGAIGPNMTALAGELALGILTHPTNSSTRFLREVTRADLERGAARSGRTAREIELIANPACAFGSTRAAVAEQRERQRALLGILLSTPSYWPNLELLGQGEVGRRLRQRVRAGEWDRLAGEIGDELLDALVPAARYEELADALRARYAGVAQGICLPLPPDPADDPAFARVIRELRT
jgi:probable F420-dependent oxidoreductase